MAMRTFSPQRRPEPGETMSAAAKITLTNAETALVESFVDRFGRLPGNARVVQARDKAISAIRSGGLPTRRIEAWHYTDLRRLLASVPKRDANANTPNTEALLDGSHVVMVRNGRMETPGALAGVSFKAMSDLLKADIGGIELPDVDRDDAVGLINTAFVGDGIHMAVEPGATIDTPVELNAVHGGGQTHTRNLISLGADAATTIIDHMYGSDDEVLSTNVTVIELAENASATYVRVQNEGDAATHLGRIEISLAAGAQLTLYVVNLSGKLVREEIHAAMTGEGADLAFRSVNMLADSSHCDVTLELDHAVPNTTSTETVRNVIMDKAQGVFQGQIRVAQIAQKTDAQMACNTLLLSDDAGISVKPELEIFADDVVCAHGATVAEIDHDHLFYLMARGVTEKTARALLVKAFVAEIIEELDNEPLVEALEAKIDNWLHTHG